MYEVYSTKAFVLRSVSKKEFDQDVLLFTYEFGLIKVKVSSSKKDSSKHKTIVQDFSFIEVFLIISNSGYRMTGGQFLDNIYFLKDENGNIKIKIIKNIFLLFEKIFLKNVSDKKMFLSFEKFYFDLIKNDGDLKKKEIFFIMEILSEMGYLNKDKLLKESKEKENDTEFLIKKINSYIKNIDF